MSPQTKRLFLWIRLCFCFLYAMLRSYSQRMDPSQRAARGGVCHCFGEESEVDSVSSRRSWLEGDRKMSNGECSSWWQKSLNSVRKAGEWSENLIETRSGPKWRLFIRRLKNEGRSIYPRKTVRCQYDAFSYAQNFDEGSWQETENPYQCFSARFGAPLPKSREI